MDELSALRARIDAIDARLIATLHERMEAVRQVGEIKKQRGVSFRDDRRWREVLEKRTAQAEASGLDPGFIRELYELIHTAALTVEERP
jgi:chorismate mutase